MAAVIISLLFTGISVFRAHRNDLGKSRYEVLRPKDRAIIEMNKDYLGAGRKDTVELDYFDAQ